MRAFAWGLAFIVILSVAGGIYWMARRELPPPPNPETIEPSHPPTTSPNASVVSEPATKPTHLAPSLSGKLETEAPRRPRGRLTIKPGEAIPELFPYQAERDRLVNLAASQDAGNIPVIANSLRHADAIVREAARQALIQMGNSAAIPHLQKAEAAAKDATEAELLREAIEFLSLPNFMDVITSSSGASVGN